MGIAELDKEELVVLTLLPKRSDDRVQSRAVAERCIGGAGLRRRECVSGAGLEAWRFHSGRGLRLIRVNMSIA